MSISDLRDAAEKIQGIENEIADVLGVAHQDILDQSLTVKWMPDENPFHRPVSTGSAQVATTPYARWLAQMLVERLLIDGPVYLDYIEEDAK